MARGSLSARWLAAALTFAGAPAASARNLWVRHQNLLRNEAEYARATNLVARASAVGVNGLVLGASFDTPWNDDAAMQRRLVDLNEYAAGKGVELIPHGWSVGYGSFCNIHDDLVETVPANGVRYVAKGGEIVPLKDEVRVSNGDLELFDAAKHTFTGWYTDSPGVETFVDTEIRHSGKASMRVEPGPGKDKYNQGRICGVVGVKPGRRYRLTAHFRAENLFPTYESIMMVVNRDDGSNAGLREVNRLEVTEGWRKVSLEFPAGGATVVNVFCGTWSAKSGRFWVDDISVEEVAVRELSCRKGDPLVLKSAASGREYRPGTDFTVRKQPRSQEVVFLRPAGSAIPDGEELLLDAYVWGRSGPKMQLSTCLSDPKLYEEMRRSAKWINDRPHPKKWVLSLDELRNGGTCPLCSARKTDMAHIFGACVTKMHGILRSENPDVEIYTWSDMFDPNHNAQDGYLGCKGTFKGVWDLIPKDITMILWWQKMAPKSAPFFTSRGFRIMGSICCDGKNPACIDTWRRNIGSMPETRGFMYTTWSDDYGLLETFCRELRQPD